MKKLPEMGSQEEKKEKEKHYISINLSLQQTPAKSQQRHREISSKWNLTEAVILIIPEPLASDLNIHGEHILMSLYTCKEQWNLCLQKRTILKDETDGRLQNIHHLITQPIMTKRIICNFQT